MGTRRQAVCAPEKFTDVHCHCLPNLDDGPGSMDHALALCRSLVRDNIRTVIATPHQLGRFESHTDAAAVRDATEGLNRALREARINLTVWAGAEARLDERMSALLSDDVILTLADMRRHLLVEFPEGAFIDVEPLVADLSRQNVDLIIAHPERNMPLLRHPHVLWRWLNRGVNLQVTAGSLTGQFGSNIQEAGWKLVAQGWVAVVATDAHDCNGNGPCMTAAFAMIGARLGRRAAHLLCIENPARVLDGENLVPLFAWDRREVL